MKEIKLIRLEMENFKSHKHLRLDFYGRNAVISGRNATGKSSIYDSLMWLLFGKNSEGKGAQSFEVKPIGSDGNVLDHNALTSVEAVFDVSGEEVTLKRTYREKWETRRVSSEAVFSGHTSEYTVDGVPVKQNAFQQKVGELVDEDTFRLLTSITYFPRDISWQERRSILFKIAGVMDDRDILASDGRFAPLVESMGKLTPDEYKRKLLAEKKGFSGVKSEIPARISECQKTIDDIRELDFAAARAAAEALQIEKDAVAAQILAIDHDNAAEQKAMQIREVKLELATLESQNRAFRDRQAAACDDSADLQQKMAALQARLVRESNTFANENNYIAEQDRLVAEARTAWMSVYAESFTGGVCVSCGQQLPAEAMQKAVAAFEKDKANRLREIEKAANYHKEAKAQAEDRLERQQEQMRQTEADIAALKARISAAGKVDIQDMDGYAQKSKELRETIEKLNIELSQIHGSAAGVKMQLRKQMAELTEKLDQQNSVITKEGLLQYARNRIEQLREEAKNNAACLEAIEKMLYLLEEYSRYKTRFVEETINCLFRIARFRLFRQQANGGIEDVCDVVYNGIVYGDVNTGMKINLGIDIINTLSAAYGVRVPLFIDNAESVTDWEQINGQIIRLEAKKEDKELRVNYENP